MSMILDRVMYPMCFEELIDNGGGVQRRVRPAQKDSGNPLLVPDRPWEGRSVVYPSVIRCPDTGRWRMWYACSVPGFQPSWCVAYAESEDGVHWDKPELNRVEYDGSKANNLVCPPLGQVPCVYLDRKAEPSQRYRMALHRTGQYQDEGRISFFVSGDGLDWEPLVEGALHIRNDSQNTFLRDPASGQWRMFHRPGFGVRTMQLSTSEDGIKWKGSRQILVPDAVDQANGQELYAMAVFPYDGGFIPTHQLVECLAHREDPARPEHVPFVKTRPVLCQGDALTLSYDAADREIRASLVYEDGTVPEGFSEMDSSVLTGHSTAGTILFKGGSLKQFGRVPIHIIVRMERGTKLYGFGVL